MLTVGFGGDTSLGDAHLRKADPHLQSILKDRPESFLEDLQPLLKGCDQVVLNLETVLSRRPSSPWKGQKKYLGWDTPHQTIRALRSVGTTHVSLANNHTMDFGGDVLLETIRHLDNAGIAYTGAGANLFEAVNPCILHATGRKRVYLISGMEVQRRLRDDFMFYAGTDAPGVNPLSVESVVTSIGAIRAVDPEGFIIVTPHWGRNYRWATRSMAALNDAMADAGANLVIGHGAHMLGEIGSRNGCLSVFSLGNFVFNWAGRFDKFEVPPYGLVARLSIEPTDAGWSGKLKLYPILSDNKATTYRPRPVTGVEFQEVEAMLMARSGPYLGEESLQAVTDDRGRCLSLEISV